MYDLYDKSSESDRKAIVQWSNTAAAAMWATGPVGKEADAAVVKDPSRRYEIAQKHNDLNRELAAAPKARTDQSSLNERESECLEISALRSSELGLPRLALTAFELSPPRTRSSARSAGPARPRCS